MGATTEMALDTPDRVQRGLYRALNPGGGKRDVVSRKEDATLIGGQSSCMKCEYIRRLYR
jgi:hypothetical protein